MILVQKSLLRVRLKYLTDFSTFLLGASPKKSENCTSHFPSKLVHFPEYHTFSNEATIKTVAQAFGPQFINKSCPTYHTDSFISFN